MVSRSTRTSERTPLPGRGGNIENETEVTANQQPAPTNGGNGHALVEASTNGLASDEMPEWMRARKGTGAGLSQKLQDNLIPQASLIQINAKRQNRGETAYIEGAESGMVYVPVLGSPPKSLIRCRKGKWGQNPEFNEPGMLVLPCFQQNGIAEWGQRIGASGGGFKGYHRLIDDDVKKTMKELGAEQKPNAQNPSKMDWVKGDRVFVETRQFALILLVEAEIEKGVWRPTGETVPISLNFKSTEHTFAKGWMMQMNLKKAPGSNDRADMWWSLWRLHVRYRSDNRGSWFEWFTDWEGWNTDEKLDAQGEALHRAFLSGEKEMVIEDEGSSDSGTGNATYASSSINPDDMDVPM